MQIKNLGQVWTPNYIVSDMIKLIKNKGKILEPSCGNGAFYNRLHNCVGIEYDKNLTFGDIINIDFFDYPITEKFDTIIGNPPYVRHQDILPSTKTKLDMTLFDERSNLYLFFIYKCILHLNDHGELIFIVPRDFLKATSAQKLNSFLYDNGTITNFIDLGDELIFKDACPNCVIFRFEKDNFSRITNGTKIFKVVNGQVIFISHDYSVPFKDLFYVKVGAVSGADKYFISESGNQDFVCSETFKTGQTRKMFYNVSAPELLPYKDFLINRKIKKYNNDNWFEWGRNYYKSDKERIYVNCKTRQEKPFFTHPCKAYDGSVLAIFPKFDCTEKTIKEITEELNNVDWNELGFICGNRYLFNQRSLENCLLPKIFCRYYSYIC